MKRKNTIPLDEQWVYAFDGWDTCEGPFRTRDEALGDARDGHLMPGESKRVHLGHPAWPDPTAAVHDDLDWHLEHMEELAFNNADCSGEELAFEIADGDKEGAQKALTEALRSWASKWVEPAHWYMRETENFLIVGEGKD